MKNGRMKETKKFNFYYFILALLTIGIFMSLYFYTIALTPDKATDYAGDMLNMLCIIFTLVVTIYETNRNTFRQMIFQQQQEKADELERAVSMYITDIWKYYFDCRHSKEADRSQAIGVYYLVRVRYMINADGTEFISALTKMHESSSYSNMEIDEFEKLENKLLDETKKLSKKIRESK